MTGIPVIIFAKDIIPEQSVIDKAREEDIVLLTSPLTVFELSGKIYTLLQN
jgi:serine kinase of HPr protein (carbohydrate metabolism regulator)